MLRSVLLAALLFVCAAAMLNAQTTASVPRALSYQGVLTEPNGTLMQDGEYTISVRLYDELNAANPIYIEQHKVIVVRGLFNLLIGSQIPIPAAVRFDRAYFLGVSVNGTEEMKPRTPLTASPYALRAETAARADVATVAENLAPNAKAVSSVNSLSGDVMLKAGTGIALNQQGNEITITSTPANGTAADNKGNKLLGTYGFTGDLTGTANTNANFGSWSVRIAQNGATNGQVLQWNTSQGRWIPGTISTTPTGTAGGSLSGSYPNPSLVANSVGTTQIANGAVTDAKVASGISASKISGDISGNAANVTGTVALANGGTGATTATGARTNLGLGSLATQNTIGTADITNGSVTLPKLSSTGASNGQVIGYDGTNIVWQTAGGVPTGNAGGDLIGTYPMPQIGSAVINNSHISNTAAIAYSKLSLTNSITNSDITANAITTSKVANGTVTTSKMADSAITGLKLLTRAVQTAHINDGAVTDAQVANGISYTKLSGAPTSLPPNGAAGGDLTGTYPNPTIGSAVINNSHISNTAAIAYSKLSLTNSIANSDITANAITTSKVANGTVTTSKMADSAITGLKLLTNAVRTAHINDGEVTLPKLSSTGASNGQVIGYDGTSIVWQAAGGAPSGAAGGDLTGTYPNPTIASGAVTSGKILDGTIVDADISSTAAIAYSKLSLINSITNSDITANAITTSKVANGTVTTSKMADSAITGLKLLTRAVQTAHINDGAVTDAQVANGISYTKLSGAPTSLPPNGAAGGDLTGTYPNPTIANSAVTPAKISSSGASAGNVLTYNGSSVAWAAPSGGGATVDLVVTKTSSQTLPIGGTGVTPDDIIFNNVLTSPTAGSFDNTTGVYTTTSSGSAFYLISVTTATDGGVATYPEIVIGGVTAAVGAGTASPNLPNPTGRGSISQVFSIPASTAVKIKLANGSTSTTRNVDTSGIVRFTIVKLN